MGSPFAHVWGDPNQPLGLPGTPFVSPGGNGEVPPMALPTTLVRVYEAALWSSYRYVQGAAVANRGDDLFATPLNSSGQGWANPLSIGETNMEEAGRMPTGQSLAVVAIALQPYATGGLSAAGSYGLVANDLRNINANLVIGWKFLNTFISISTAALIGQGGGVFGGTADTGAADGVGGSREILTHGNGGLWIYREFPVMLAAGVTFRVQLKWGALAVVIDGNSTGTDAYALALKLHLIGKVQTAVETA